MRKRVKNKATEKRNPIDNIFVSKDGKKYFTTGGITYCYIGDNEFIVKNIPKQKVSKKTIKKMTTLLSLVDKETKWKYYGQGKSYYIFTPKSQRLYEKFWQKYRNAFDNLFPVTKGTRKLMLDPDYNNSEYRKVLNPLIEKINKFECKGMRIRNFRWGEKSGARKDFDNMYHYMRTLYRCLMKKGKTRKQAYNIVNEETKKKFGMCPGIVKIGMKTDNLTYEDAHRFWQIVSSRKYDKKPPYLKK